RAPMDDIGGRGLGPNGETVVEVRPLGLFTSKAYMESVSRIPVLRRKLAEVTAAEDLIEGSHDYKAVVSLIESFPKDELFALPTEDLRRRSEERRVRKNCRNIRVLRVKQYIE